MANFKNSIITLKNLRIDTIIGCYRFEKDIKQPLFIDLDLETDISKVSESDNLDHALDYVIVVEIIQNLAESHGCELLESFANKIINELEKMSQIISYVLVIKKPNAIPDSDYVSLKISNH